HVQRIGGLLLGADLRGDVAYQKRKAAPLGGEHREAQSDAARRADHGRGGGERRGRTVVVRTVGPDRDAGRSGQQDQYRRAQGARRPRRQGKAGEPGQRHDGYVAAGIRALCAQRNRGLPARRQERGDQAAVASRLNGTPDRRCSSSNERPSTISTTWSPSGFTSITARSV